MEEKITIYVDADNRVWTYQDEEELRAECEVSELPTIPNEPLKEGYHIYSDGVFSFGYELNENKCYGAINDLKAELRKTDYISHKESDGEDVSSYINCKALRQDIRDQINKIEQLLKLKKT